MTEFIADRADAWHAAMHAVRSAIAATAELLVS